jgi:hypothetical protein
MVGASGEARAEAGGALKHCSNIVHYCSALLHEGILVLGGVSECSVASGWSGG